MHQSSKSRCMCMCTRWNLVSSAPRPGNCVNIHERVEVVEWNKRWSPPFPFGPVSRQYPSKKTLIEKKNQSKTITTYVCIYKV